MFQKFVYGMQNYIQRKKYANICSCFVKTYTEKDKTEQEKPNAATLFSLP